MSELIQGIFPESIPDVPRMSYLSPSKISTLKESPKKFYHQYKLGNFIDKTKAMTVGDWADKCLLDRKLFDQLVVAPDFGNQTFKVNKEAKQKFLANTKPGVEIIEESKKKLIERMIDSVLSNPDARRLLECSGVSQSCVYAQHSSGLWLHGKVDRLIDQRGVVEFKTTTGLCEWEDFVWKVIEFEYHMALSFYLTMVEIIHKIPEHNECAWIVVEQKEPFDCKVYYPNEEQNLILKAGRIDVRNGIEKFLSLTKADPEFNKPEVWHAGRSPEPSEKVSFPYHVMVRKPEWSELWK